MDRKLLGRAAEKFFGALLAAGALLFLPAGTPDFWQAWLLPGVLFLPMLAAGLVMLAVNPELPRKRLDSREEQGEQRAVVALGALMFLAVFVLSGLNRRFAWLPLPAWVSWAAAGIFLAAYGLYAEVLWENTWLSRTVEVQEGQKVVDTGLYGVVRHPMYMATVLLFLSLLPVPGSLPSFAVMLLYIPLIVRRIRNEEQVLEAGLAGYAEYRRKVKYRLFPFVW